MKITMAERKVRVRFAPSPTGALHIGGVRTALYNYLFARQHGGDLIFRIEDTDSNRFVPGAEEYIIESFRWLGIKFDEGVSFGGNYGPYRQSERRDIYKKYVQILLDNGKAYIAFDTPEELEAKRKEIANFQYDATTRTSMRNSLTLPKEEVDKLIAEGKQYVVRFKIEPNEDVHVHDIIRGEVVINSSILDDKVLYNPAEGEHLDNYPVMLGLTREMENRQQKILVLGDADALSNSGILAQHGLPLESGNYQLMMGMFHWLSDHELPVDVRRPAPVDNKLFLGTSGALILDKSVTWAIPGLLLLVYLIIWIRRRGR